MRLLLALGLALAILFVGCKGAGDHSIADGSVTPNRFAPQVITGLEHGYIDSVFVNKDATRIYFLYSILAPLEFLGVTTPGNCAHGALPFGHQIVSGVEWNSDLYYIEWNGASWSAPVNLGANINSLGNECCLWLNDGETEIIFYRGTDLDNNGNSGDLGAPISGNYRAVRASRNSAWGAATALSTAYGTDNQSNSVFRHDIHKTPSGNLYLWGKDAGGSKTLLFGQWNGTGYDAPAAIAGSVTEDTQPWVNASETALVFNHRALDGTTSLRKMTRASASDAWSAPSVLPTSGFADSKGAILWGEPSFDASQSFMLYVQFDTTDSLCWKSDIMYAPGNLESGFSSPVKLTR